MHLLLLVLLCATSAFAIPPHCAGYFTHFIADLPGDGLKELELKKLFPEAFILSKEGFVVAYERDGGPRLGKLVYAVEEKRIAIIDVSIDRKDVGLAKVLYEKMLEQNPKVTELSGKLTDDNRAAYFTALHGDPAKGIPPKTPAEAIRETPAYKLRAGLGFTVVSRESALPDVAGDTLPVLLVMAKP